MVIPKPATLIAGLLTALNSQAASADAHTQPMVDRPAIVFFLSVINPSEIAAYDRYSAGSAQLLSDAGAVTTGRFGVERSLVGDCDGTFFGYAEVERVEALETVFGSDDYKALIPDREKAFTSLNLYFGNSNAVGANSIVLTPGSSVVLRIGVGSGDGRETGYTVLASFDISKHLAGDCAADVIQLIEVGNAEDWMDQNSDQASNMFLLKN